MTTKKNNKKLMLIFVAAFLIPVLLAKLALENGWFNKASTNKGELLQPTLDMTGLQSEDSHKWKLLYVLPETCEQACENALYAIAQVRTALGRESDRAESLVIAHEKSHLGQIESINSQQNVSLVKTSLQNVSQVFKDTSTDAIFIADTLNNIILRYPIYVDSEQAVLHSRDILSDLKKVLKLSRIG